ncbi:hypothetical protein HMPREF9554_03047 [Treponema phagedenis F0421]|nr:hypothetical protein HMPREF9554_03047 [Treponema phagedenis F0421]
MQGIPRTGNALFLTALSCVQLSEGGVGVRSCGSLLGVSELSVFLWKTYPPLSKSERARTPVGSTQKRCFKAKAFTKL